VISASSGDFNARADALERYLDELDRKTFSNFAVTNPLTGMKNLEVGPDPTTGEHIVRLRDDNGNVIYGNRPEGGVLGIRMPLPMYPSVPEANVFSNDATWLTTWESILFATSSGLQGAYRLGDREVVGATIEGRMLYDIGAGQVVIPESVASRVNPVNAIIQFIYQWPTNLFNTPVTLTLQCRVSLAGAFDSAAIASPMYVLGA
jgi:hypothetical protein